MKPAYMEEYSVTTKTNMQLMFEKSLIITIFLSLCALLEIRIRAWETLLDLHWEIQKSRLSWEWTWSVQSYWEEKARTKKYQACE